MTPSVITDTQHLYQELIALQFLPRHRNNASLSAFAAVYIRLFLIHYIYIYTCTGWAQQARASYKKCPAIKFSADRSAQDVAL